ncbi:hypothetical protein cyc_08462 [Cyclospora cayetanensis]|uniref:Uncharacterized protein n=1 Tax=Cyclospora cayetanensis TaxID=88456 RepID=A0A1D3D6N1_9EIME|nr:hypothetical protein cyc_08462 [Cyclospora cayetanensis]
MHPGRANSAERSVRPAFWMLLLRLTRDTGQHAEENGHHQRKDKALHASTADRLEMTRLAVKSFFGPLSGNAVEILTATPYADCIASLHKWYEGERLMRTARFLVIDRHGFSAHRAAGSVEVAAEETAEPQACGSSPKSVEMVTQLQRMPHVLWVNEMLQCNEALSLLPRVSSSILRCNLAARRKGPQQVWMSVPRCHVRQSLSPDEHASECVAFSGGSPSGVPTARALGVKGGVSLHCNFPLQFLGVCAGCVSCKRQKGHLAPPSFVAATASNCPYALPTFQLHRVDRRPLQHQQRQLLKDACESGFSAAERAGDA